MPSSIRSRKSAHGQEKYTPPLITTILMSQHGAHYIHNTPRPGPGRPLFQVFSLLAVHICCPCARLPESPQRRTQGAGAKPKVGICEATSALSETNWGAGQDCVVLVACGRDPAARRGGGGTNTERKDICSRSLNTAARGSSFFAQRLVYLC